MNLRVGVHVVLQFSTHVAAPASTPALIRPATKRGMAQPNNDTDSSWGSHRPPKGTKPGRSPTPHKISNIGGGSAQLNGIPGFAASHADMLPLWACRMANAARRWREGDRRCIGASGLQPSSLCQRLRPGPSCWPPRRHPVWPGQMCAPASAGGFRWVDAPMWAAPSPGTPRRRRPVRRCPRTTHSHRRHRRDLSPDVAPERRETDHSPITEPVIPAGPPPWRRTSHVTVGRARICPRGSRMAGIPRDAPWGMPIRNC